MFVQFEECCIFLEKVRSLIQMVYPLAHKSGTRKRNVEKMSYAIVRMVIYACNVYHC